MFWGITLDVGKRYTQTVEQSFHLSMAALGFQNSSAVPVTIMVEVEKAQYALCTLMPGSIPQQALDYTFTEGEEITFFTEGQGEVHLTGYLIEEVEPVDFEGENELSESEESESQSAGSDEESDEESKSSSGEEVTLQDLLLGVKEEEELQEDDSEDDDDWDPSKSNPMSKKKKKDKKKKRKGLRNDEASESREPKAASGFVDLFNDHSSEDEDEKGGVDEPSKKTKGKKRKAKKLKMKLNKNGESVEQERTTDKTDIQDERPKKKAKKSMGSTTLSVSDVMHINVNESKRTVKQADTPNAIPRDSEKSQNVQSPNKNKSLSTDTEGKSDGRQQDKSPSVSPTKKSSSQLVKKTLPGGVHIEDLRKGTGQVAKNGQRVSLLYKGVLAKNKKQFDANLNRKSPFTFVLGKGSVIRGWDLGVAGMQVGGKRKLVIPPSQGYGNERTGHIPPQSTLEFEVELLSTK